MSLLDGFLSTAERIASGVTEYRDGEARRELDIGWSVYQQRVSGQFPEFDSQTNADPTLATGDTRTSNPLIEGVDDRVLYLSAAAGLLVLFLVVR